MAAMTMKTPKEYRLRAKECLRLANEATEFYVKVALAELATEFRKMADGMEPGPAAETCRRARHRRANNRAFARAGMAMSTSTDGGRR
jgi:hypothetical protein